MSIAVVWKDFLDVRTLVIVLIGLSIIVSLLVMAHFSKRSNPYRRRLQRIFTPFRIAVCYGVVAMLLFSGSAAALVDHFFIDSAPREATERLVKDVRLAVTFGIIAAVLSCTFFRIAKMK